MQVRVLDVRGPGDFSVWQTGSFGDVRAFVASSDGLDEQDVFRATIGSHTHAHLGFTAPGRYEIDMQARTFDADNTELLSPVTTFTFEARPPACPHGCGDLNGDGVVDLADYAAFQRCLASPLNASEACACANLNSDAAIDVRDFDGLAQRLGTAPIDPWPDCP
jgi:surface-anchored protein